MLRSIMDKVILEQLNSIYKPLCEKSIEITQGLVKRGYIVSSGFYNNHSVKIDGSFATEYFPIPVIIIKGVGDADFTSSIGIEIDVIWFEVVLSKDILLKQDIEMLAREYKIEIYGVKDYLSDIFSADVNPVDIVPNVLCSSETHFCITFYLEQDVALNELVDIANMFQNKI